MDTTVRQFVEKLGKFSAEEIDALLKYMEVAEYKKGTVIIQQGKVCDQCYFLLKGCLRQYQLVDGEEKTTGFFLDGQPVILYSSYLKEKPVDYYIACIEDSILLAGNRQQERDLYSKYPNLENLVQALMLIDYSKAEDYIELLNCYGPEERYLILMEKHPEYFNRIPLHYIAGFLGVTAESLSRIRKRISANDKSNVKH